MSQAEAAAGGNGPATPRRGCEPVSVGIVLHSPTLPESQPLWGLALDGFAHDEPAFGVGRDGIKGAQADLREAVFAPARLDRGLEFSRTAFAPLSDAPGNRSQIGETRNPENRLAFARAAA